MTVVFSVGNVFLMQDFLKPCNHIAHHVCVVHSGVFYGEVGGFPEFSVCCLKKIEPNPRPLGFCHSIPFANRKSELALPVKNYSSYIHSLVLSVQSSGDVSKLEKFSNGRKCGRYRVSRIVEFFLTTSSRSSISWGIN